MPFSYAQYAGNGSTTTFSVPFPYLLKAHVKVYLGFNILDGTFSSELADGVGFNWTSGTQIQTVTAPSSGQTLTVIRQTPNATRLVDWQDGSNLTSSDLDTADIQNLYVVQEQQDRNDAVAAQQAAATQASNSALAASTAATATANSASATANSASATANGLAASIAAA
ncbi:MAG: uncultured phage MedDCM-OCT-S37-C6, partial [Cyanobacteriota bacterium]